MAHKKKILIDPKSLALPCCGVDTHAHLASDRLWKDIDEVLARAKDCGISHIGQIFLSHQSYMEKKDYFLDKPHVFFVYGVHPTDSLKTDDNEIDQMVRDILADREGPKKIRAIGEIGLDYYWKEVPASLQEYYFRKQLNNAKDLDIPVVVHSRDAFEDTMRILLEEDFSGRPLLWHCFDKDSECAKRIIANGWYISIPGQVTYKANVAMREALHHIPTDKLVLETDCPYLSPEPWRGQTNEPALSVFTAKCVAEELGRDIQELWGQCGDNARRFFSVVA